MAHGASESGETDSSASGTSPGSPSWQTLLGLPADVKTPDLYQVLGLARQGFSSKAVEPAFKARLAKLAALGARVDRHKVERATAELQRARRLLVNAAERARYDVQLSVQRAAKLRRGLERELAKGPLTVAVEKALVSAGVRLGMSEDEARDVLREGLKMPPVPEKAAAPRASNAATLVDAPGEDSSVAASSAERPAAPTRAQLSESAVPVAGSTHALVGKTIDGKYHVLSLLGEGGMGTVFKVRHVLLDKELALKVVSPALAHNSMVRERFFREAKAAMAILHAHAIPLRDFGLSQDGLLYMTQDFSPGESLRSILDREKTLPWARALEITRQCLLALGEAHRHGVVHRDLKPENVLVETEGGKDTARLCDFGIAKIADGDLTTEGGASLTGGAVIGTPYYMAPEQGAGDAVDARADIYTLGCVLHEMLTGTKLFDGETAMQVIMKHVTEPPDPPSKRRPGLPAALDPLVLKALAKSKDERYASADELVAAIDEVSRKLAASRTSARLAPVQGSGRLARAEAAAPVKTPAPSRTPAPKVATKTPAPAKPAAPSKAKTGANKAVKPAVARPGKTPSGKTAAAKGKTGSRTPSGQTAMARTPAGKVPPKRPDPKLATPSTSGRVSKTPLDLGLKFCDRCNVSIPDNWEETQGAKRVGTKLVCARCWIPIHEGRACVTCSRSVETDPDAVAAGGKKKVCRACAARASFLRTCSGCQVILPEVAFERREAFSIGGKFYCRSCAKKVSRSR